MPQPTEPCRHRAAPNLLQGKHHAPRCSSTHHLLLSATLLPPKSSRPSSGFISCRAQAVPGPGSPRPSIHTSTGPAGQPRKGLGSNVPTFKEAWMILPRLDGWRHVLLPVSQQLRKSLLIHPLLTQQTGNSGPHSLRIRHGSFKSREEGEIQKKKSREVRSSAHMAPDFEFPAHHSRTGKTPQILFR